MSDSPTRVGGTSRLGWQTGTNDRMALGEEPETRRRIETRRVDRPDPGGARRAGSVPRREPERPPRSVRRPPVVPEFTSIPGTRGASEVPTRRARLSGRTWRRLTVVLGAVAVLITVAVTMSGAFEHNDSFPAPSAATLAGLSVPQRVVALAQSQVGYATQPSNSYCNKFSAYWDAGQATCGSGLRSEEWCADFAAWAWREAGVQFTYGYAPGEINGGTISFYEWAVDNGLWHPAVSGYVASPGDVAVYGITLGANPSAAHVAIVVDDPGGQAGPNVVNGDGDQTGYSVVEAGSDQLTVHTAQDNVSNLDGYVSLP
jgi:hypothetical protein